MQLEYHQLDLRYANLRLRRPMREGRLVADLAEHGQLVPVVVVDGSERDQRYVLIDGFLRMQALRRLGSDTVCATLWELSELEALLLHRCLRAQEQETALEQAWLLCELRRRFGLSLLELASRLGRTKGWASRRLALVEQLPESVQELIREGKICPHAAQKSLVPLARANRRACEQLAKAISARQLTSREVEALWRAWRSGSRMQRKKLLAGPELYLRAHRGELEQEAEQTCPVRRLVSDLEGLAAISRRARKRVSELRTELATDERQAIELSFAQTQADFQGLVMTMAGVFTPPQRAPHHAEP